jgi:hypothetical protein
LVETDQRALRHHLIEETLRLFGRAIAPMHPVGFAFGRDLLDPLQQLLVSRSSAHAPIPFATTIG